MLRKQLQSAGPILDRWLRYKCLEATCSSHSAITPSNATDGSLTRFWKRAFSLPADAAAETLPQGFKSGKYCVSDFPPDQIRSFSILAHIDHGKSTLADRLMEMTGAIAKGSKAQYLDKLDVERERGITVKAQTASLVYRHQGKAYLLNLIDTPGHVDFSYEVSRSLSAVNGALLLVDAAQGIQTKLWPALDVFKRTVDLQAQTVANFYLAFEQNLEIVPLLNKCDMQNAEPDRVAEQMLQVFDLEPEECLRISAKTGKGLDALLPAIVEKIPPPGGKPDGELRMLLFDAVHDDYRGVICLVKIVDGEVLKGDKVTSISSGMNHDVLEVGLLTPEPCSTGKLLTGQVGYIITGMKSTKLAQIGDTWHRAKKPVEPLPGFKQSKSMIFAGVFPASAAEFEQLTAAMDRLTLNDSSVSVQRENSAALGAGFRCGFLGLLHMEVFHQRLEDEHKASVITTSPTVPYKLSLFDGKSMEIQNPSQFPLGVKIQNVWEPTVSATIITPNDHVGAIMNLCQDRRGTLTDHNVLGPLKSMLRYDLPLAELGGSFYDDLKSISSGYASFDYEEGEMRTADLVRLDLLLNGEPVDALARIVHRSKAQSTGRYLCGQLRDLLERQMYEISIQAAANGKIVARETLKAFRKNVLAKCYGGDVSRKRKLLEKQKEGKKRMARMVAGVDVPQEVFHAFIKTSH